jgi:uncharacterized protein YktB (UPF0637 family)
VIFRKESFEVFDIAGLEPRMVAIRAEIQPIFQEIGEKILVELQKAMPRETFYLHIAQHRRRTTYAPESTWCAISTQKRGYKMEPCLVLAIWRHQVFFSLSILDQPKGQVAYGQSLAVVKFDKGLQVSKSHLTSEIFDLSELTNFLTRLQTVKQSEFEVGRAWSEEKMLTLSEKQFLSDLTDTMGKLIPAYKACLEVRP